MRESITGDDIFASAVMLRAADDVATVLVEGINDAKCLGVHVNASSARLLPCHGSKNLDRARQLVDQESVVGVLAIRDSDWYGVLHDRIESDNLVYTDLYDLDSTIMLSTGVGRRVALVFGQADRVVTHCQKLGAAVPDELVVRVASRLGLLRAASELAGLSLSLRDFPFQEVLDVDSLAISDERVIAIAIRRTAGCFLSVEEVLAAMDVEELRVVPPLRLCSGHELAAVLSLLCRSAWGGGGVGRELLLQSVRSALSCAELQQLELYEAVRGWESRTNYRVWECTLRSEAA